MSSVKKDLMSQKGSLVSLYVKPRKRWGKFKCSKWRSDKKQKKRAARFYSTWFSSRTKNYLLAAQRRTFTWLVARKGNWAALGPDPSAHIRSISWFWVHVSGQSLNFYLHNFVCWDSDLCNFVGWDSVMKKTFPPLSGPMAKVLPQGKLSVLTWKL